MNCYITFSVIDLPSVVMKKLFNAKQICEVRTWIEAASLLWYCNTNSLSVSTWLHFIYFIMGIARNFRDVSENNTLTVPNISTTYWSNKHVDPRAQSILIIQSTIASVGIVANLSVIIVFLNHRKLRRKVPNIFIVNQVRTDNQGHPLILHVIRLLSFKYNVKKC